MFFPPRNGTSPAGTVESSPGRVLGYFLLNLSKLDFVLPSSLKQFVIRPKRSEVRICFSAFPARQYQVQSLDLQSVLGKREKQILAFPLTPSSGLTLV